MTSHGPKLNVSPRDIDEAEARLAAHLQPTPLAHSVRLSEKFSRDVFLKLECMSPTGSFKIRPALNSILAHLAEARMRGVVTSSSGNFAQGAALAAKKLGVRAIVVMTPSTAPNKIEATRALGAEVVICGPNYEDRWTKVEEVRAARGSLVIHPFDSVETIAGDATVGREILNQLPVLKPGLQIIVPASGGGLISGIALAIHEKNPEAQIFGAQPEALGALGRSFLAGAKKSVPAKPTMADALVATTPGDLTLEICRAHVKDFFFLEEKDFAPAVRLLHEEKIPAEPGGAAAVAALLGNANRFQTNGPLVCVVSGQNISDSARKTIFG